MTYEKIVEYAKKKAANIKTKSDAAVQVDITGEGEGAFYVAVKDGNVDVAGYEYYGHDAKVIVDGSKLIAFLDGKEDESVLTIEGDAEKAVIIKEMASKKAAAKKAAPAAKKPAAKPAEKKAAPAKKAAAKPAEKKAEPAKEAAKPVEKAAEKPAEKKAEPAKKAAPAAKKPAAKPAAKKK